MKKFISGNQAVVEGALAAGAKAMYGYPITPSTEILQGWAAESDNDSNLIFLQTEDETSAGFCVNGSVLKGVKTFTATAGPGTVLMQDGLSMAENLRLPSVTVIMQRGGPSTGTVNYSQQEVNLACFGGNGEGLRIVYSVSSPQELYDYTIKAFDSAWRYRFPAIVLGDGYIGKQKTSVNIYNPINQIKSHDLLLKKNYRNCFSSEKQFYSYLMEAISDYNKIPHHVTKYTEIGSSKATSLIVCHGSTFETVKSALNDLGPKKNQYYIFRPITLSPFPKDRLNEIIRRFKEIIIIESSFGQLSRLVKSNLSLEHPIVEREFLSPAYFITKNKLIDYLEK